MQRVGATALVPLAACVLFAGYGLSAASPTLPVDPGEARFGIERVVVLGSAYLWSLIICLRNWPVWTHLLRRQWPYLILLAYILASASWSYFPRKVLIDWGHFAGHTLVAAGAAFHLLHRPRRIAVVVAGCCAVIVAASIPVSVTMPSVGTDLMTGRWQGITGNSNTLGLICLLALWACLSGWYLYPELRMRVLYLAIATITVVALVGSRSMTAIGASAFMLLALAVFQRLGTVSVSARGWLVSGLVLATTLVVLTLLAFVPELLRPETALSSLGRETTLTGRQQLWAFAIEKILEKPMTGWGFDSLASALAGSDFAYGQMHNGYLDLLVRGGAIGLVLALIVVLRTLYLAALQLQSRHCLGAPLLALVLALLLHNVTEATLFRAASVNSLLIVLSYTFLELYAAATAALRLHPSNASRSPRPANLSTLPNLLR
jgi:exopolysaccharide production protein ExoQ